MGFFSWLVDDVLGIDLPDPHANDVAAANAAASAASTQLALTEQTNALKASNAIAQKAADDALASQKAAIAKSEAALLSPLDSESARVAGENRQRKLQSTSPFGIGLSKKLGAAPTGFRVLSGQ
ncbi:hypothetical protein [Tardiphaga robiniae]|uniref:hypothetical protein n=1 Tax=Tardiphaga robiniae TaxID=943830 RepID=UPI0015867B8F|nr:hypothetical protein [Tardiphaga robiniae]NUU41385.1 hypothetical protein [Tardiphaga robiniae]